MWGEEDHIYVAKAYRGWGMGGGGSAGASLVSFGLGFVRAGIYNLLFSPHNPMHSPVQGMPIMKLFSASASAGSRLSTSRRSRSSTLI